MGLYQRFILPRLINCACGLSAVEAQRAQIIPGARGRVLEIGFGSGLNLPFYRADAVVEVVGLEPSAEMLGLARRAASDAPFPVELLSGAAEDIPFEGASFDTVVTTYTLCSVEDPLRALSEMRRVLKSNGQLLFAEHGKAPEASVRAWQNRLNPLWRRIAGGCQLNRDVPQLLEQSGFCVDALDAAYIDGPRPLTFNYRGVASPR